MTSAERTRGAPSRMDEFGVQLFASRDGKKDWAKAIVAMRHGFGGHPYGEDEGIVEERREGRVGEIFRP